jgi:hypothetical protein
MGKHFLFADFIEEFKVSFTAISEGAGAYNDVGKWIPGAATPTPLEGIILPLSTDELRRDVNGTYTAQDRKIYTVTPLSIGQKIQYQGDTFTIDTEKPYQDHADVFIYYAKGVNK